MEVAPGPLVTGAVQVGAIYPFRSRTGRTGHGGHLSLGWTPLGIGRALLDRRTLPLAIDSLGLLQSDVLTTGWLALRLCIRTGLRVRRGLDGLFRGRRGLEAVRGSHVRGRDLSI